MEINVHNLVRFFGTTRAVDNISFSFRSGEIFGFIGPNGAGKTTTMRVLATIDEPTAGDAVIDGISLVENPEQARKLVGYMPDSLPTHRDISVHEYLDFFARAYGLRGTKRRSVVDNVEEFTNLAGIREKTLRALSKGMKQRVSLARALVHDPGVLILDEPAAGLDPRARIELRELLRALAEQGKAILISSHILTELSEIVSGAVFIEQGRILQAGSLQDIITNSLPQTTVVIHTLDEPQRVYQTLLEMPNVVEARMVGHDIVAEINGQDEQTSQILTLLIQRGFRIAEFRRQKAHLEDVFMRITKGQVQ